VKFSPREHSKRIQLARVAVEGISVGDAFGEQFFDSEESAQKRIRNREIPPGSWPYTDDTAMSLCVLETLDQHQGIRQDFLALAFAKRYREDPNRGYGGTAHRILRAIGEGVAWQAISAEVFSGMGSAGNGAAMRASPIGAYFSDDTTQVVDQSRFSAEVTHFHREGQAGAIAVALAAAWMVRSHTKDTSNARLDFLSFVVEHTPNSETRNQIAKALELKPNSSMELAVSALGNGTKLTSVDTVPIALWCTSNHLFHFEEGLWSAVSALGDRDTICAIVGGLLALRNGIKSIPLSWLNSRELIFSALP
jgi:ADP-ribosylglycohydrolase